MAARPFYSAPVKYRPDFPPPPGQIRLPTPRAQTAPAAPPGFTSDKPWMTPHLVAEIRRRNFLQNRAARSSCEEDRAAADQQRQLVNRLVNEAKERFCLAHPERTDEILASDRRARPFHCGSCDRSYGTQQQLDEHCREHVRCGLEDCPFTAHPRVVEKHVTMQHQTGLAKVIMALNTPEAIARWREQRRANFCRPESAARRQAEQAERAARGIRIPERGGRFPPAQERPGRGRGRGRGGRGRGRGAHHRPPAQQQTAHSDSDEDETCRGLAPFTGILAVTANTDAVCKSIGMTENQDAGDVNAVEEQDMEKHNEVDGQDVNVDAAEGEDITNGDVAEGDDGNGDVEQQPALSPAGKDPPAGPKCSPSVPSGGDKVPERPTTVGYGPPPGPDSPATAPASADRLTNGNSAGRD
ncbi:Nuclear fragile X mental retardation-interacting protein 1 [Amphibalanus amphitrite]|uniref:Nuclear fragile X mental retardation-interacting protein 1 n=1 Tax=Amphibalanus amphitrite TaxID=1232801 RepID=A0A6A4XHV8_AMPAM|nr:Nuclear fragile X mental retardation-interacting protein 1 [Amphibalanus amphitrite]